MKPSRFSPQHIAVFTIFLDLLGFGLIIPLQSFYAEHLGATPTIITLISSSYSLMQFLFAPMWGRLSDRFGRRPIMLISIAMSSIAHFVFAAAGQLWMLFLARMITGFGNANLGTAQAIIADTTTPENRAKGMGLIGAAFGLGFVFGPALGGVLGSFHHQLPPLCAGVLGIINFSLAWKNLPETFPPEKRNTSPHSIHSSYALFGITKFATTVNAYSIFALSLLYVLAFACMEQTVGLLIEYTWVTLPPGAERVAAATKLTAIFLVGVGITLAIVQGGLIGKLTRQFGEKKLILSGLSIVALTLVALPCIAMSKQYPLFLINGAFIAIGSALITPSLNSLLSKSATSEKQGELFGVNQSCSSLGRIIGPGMAGILFEAHTSLPFVIGGIIIGMLLFVGRKLRA